MTSKEVVRIIRAKVDFDSVSVRKNVIICKREYFYRNGASQERFAKAIQHALPQIAILSQNDFFKPWPTTSYFEVRCQFIANKAR